jgi:hypothetical protein
MVLCAGMTKNGALDSILFSSESRLDGFVCRHDDERCSRLGLFSLPSLGLMVLCAGTTKNGALDLYHQQLHLAMKGQVICWLWTFFGS